MRSKIISIYLALILVNQFLNRSAYSAEIVAVTPTGAVKQAQQVRVRFSTDMVPMGDPRSHKDPLALDCNFKVSKKSNVKPKAPAFKTRWIDSKNWSLDFDKPLKSGAKCTLKIADGTKDLAGMALTGTLEYTFSTSGPALLEIAPNYGTVEPDQYFVLQLDGLIDTKSVEKKAYFESANLPDKISVQVITGKDRDAVIRAAVKDNYRWNELVKYTAVKKPIDSIEAFKYFLVLAGKRKFPEGARIKFHWPKGILSKSGLPVEEAQAYDFSVISPFEAKFSCDRVNPERPCNPILDMKVQFSNRVKLSALKGSKIVGAGGKVWAPIELLNGDQNQNTHAVVGTASQSVGVNLINNFEDKQVDSLTFKAPFPNSTKFQVLLPKNIHDELNRKLENENNYPLDVATDDYSPLIKFAAPFGLLELKGEPILPVSVRKVEANLEAQKLSFDAKEFVLTADTNPTEVIKIFHDLSSKEDYYEKRNQPLLSPIEGKKFSVPRPGKPGDFELIGIPLKSAGFHIVEIKSEALGAALLGDNPKTNGAMYIASGALVTNLSVHLKKGRESSLIWVTQLSDAKPVADAELSIYSSESVKLASGKSDKNGIWHLKQIEFPRYGEVFVFAKKNDDFSFVSSNWSKGIEEYRFNLTREYLSEQWGPIVAHTVTDRALVKAGEIVHMKHILREHTGMGFRALNPKNLPKNVLIVHAGSRKTYTLPFDYDKATGSATSTFKLPKEASLGLYNIYLSQKNVTTASQDTNNENSDEPGEGGGDNSFDWQAQSAGQFMVSEYRLPLMESTVKIQGDPLIRPSEVKIDLSANYLSGGPASDLKVKVRATVNDTSFTPDIAGASEFTFFSDPTHAGMDEDAAQTANNNSFLFTQDLSLEKSGGKTTTIKGIPKVNQLKALTVEMEYRDPNGEVKTSSSQKTLFPSKTIVGLRTDSWIAAPGKVSAIGILTDYQGKPISNYKYSVSAYLREFITHRKRVVGGFYSYDSTTKITALGEVCKGLSDKNGRFHCDATKLPTGSIILQAKTEDDKKQPTFASVRVEVYSDQGFQWWAPSDNDRIDLVPEKAKYEPGEVAKILVQSPFPKSTVLVTVEREGVLESFVREITRENSFIEVPISGSYSPNVFISAIALRGRVKDPPPTALIDFAKPAIKMGMIELRVGWKDHQLNVKVASDHKKYRVREKAKITIHVTAANGKPLPAGAEVAIIAVDEALNRLRKNWSVDLLTNMMGQRGLAVDTSSSQNQVIGRRHFGSKAKAPGGGGGSGPSDENSRELFDPILLWEPRLKLNSSGDAQISVPLNDSISSFQIVAVAQAGMDYFGDGNTRIESSKDLIIYSGFSPVVRDGDKINNMLTMRNTTDHNMNVSINIKCAQIKKLPTFTPIALKAGESKTLNLAFEVPAATKELSFEILAKDDKSGAMDSIKTKVQVAQSVPDRILQATLFQLEKPMSIPVQQPKDAIPDRGGLDIYMQSSLVGGLASVKSYMQDYPYTCLEQKISKAIALENATEIKNIVEQLPNYFDSYGLMKFFPVSSCGSEQLSRYVLDILAENEYDLSEATKNRAVSGLVKWLDGQTQCYSWWDSLVNNKYKDQERVLILNTLSRYNAFQLAWLTTIQETPNLWQTSTLTAWIQLLDREYSIPNRAERIKDANMILRSRVNVQGSSMNLQGEPDWEASWHLFTSRDQEMMDVFNIAIQHDDWASDIGRMAKGVVARLKKGNWDTTLANAWGVTRLRQFSAKFEKEKVTGETTAKATDTVSVRWDKTPNGAHKHLAWPKSSMSSPVAITFNHNGTGQPWLLLQTRSAIPLKSALDLGYTIQRKTSGVAQKTAGKWTNGDVANIELTITAKYDQPWVVLRDPIPSGSSILGAGLEDTSAILDRDPKQKREVNDVRSWPLEYEEKSLSYLTSYAAYLPKGIYRLNYRLRLNSSGDFKLPQTRVEAMYSPETFGELPNADWKISP